MKAETEEIYKLIGFHGWKNCKAKAKKDRQRSCWISPEGDWYNVDFAEHNSFAYYVLHDIKPPKDFDEELMTIDKGGDILKNLGWILIHDDCASGTIVHNFSKMTENQYRVMKEVFGEERLFRGWTVRAMFLAKEDMKEAVE